MANAVVGKHRHRPCDLAGERRYYGSEAQKCFAKFGARNRLGVALALVSKRASPKF
jgi:hypothetical protein